MPSTYHHEYGDVAQVTAVATPVEGANWLEALRQIRADREARGYAFLDDISMRSYVEWLREDDERVDTVYQRVQDHDWKRGASQ